MKKALIGVVCQMPIRNINKISVSGDTKNVTGDGVTVTIESQNQDILEVKL